MGKKDVYILRPEKSSRSVLYVYFGILVFIIVFFPFFALTLRYQLGMIFSTVFNWLGVMCMTFGAFFIIISLVSLFANSRGSNWARNLIVGIVLIWIGCWCTGAVVKLFGFTIGSSTSGGSGGYH